jgi:hypothetical protein
MVTASVSLPQYQRSKPQFDKQTSVKISAVHAYYLPLIQKAMSAPSTASAIRLLISAEYNAICNGDRAQSDLICLDEPKTNTVVFKLSETEYKALHDIMSFYDAPTQSAVISHLIERVIPVISGKDGK